ncbi:hypothetical protein LINGRAHAP2_LOCUS30146 [Linum grandiflorum]
METRTELGGILSSGNQWERDRNKKKVAGNGALKLLKQQAMCNKWRASSKQVLTSTYMDITIMIKGRG